MIQKCVKCLVPAAVPEANIDEEGVCTWCRELESKPLENASQGGNDSFNNELEKALDDCRGRGEYDCLVPFSGGKDSCYLLYKLKK